MCLLPIAPYLLPFFICLWGGGPEDSGAGSTSSGTGTIAFDLEWQHSSQASIFPEGSQSTRQDIAQVSSDVCIDYGISTVSAKTFNSSNTQMASGSWSCSEHQGTMTGVPVGSNYWIRLEGTVSGGGICWRGEKTGISVNAGSTTQVGSVTMTYICNDATPPTVTPTNPTSGAINVPVTTSASATFSEPMALTSINTTTFTLKKGTASVTGTIAYDSGDKKATFTPSSNLDYATTYTVTITTGVTDMAGISMASNAKWSFTTEASSTGYLTREVIVYANINNWQSVGVSISPGDILEIVASGSWTCDAAQGYNGPDGNPNRPGHPEYANPSANFGSLIGKVGNGIAFLVGSSYSARIESAGSLYLGPNDNYNNVSAYVDNLGSLNVTIRTYR